MSNKLRNLQIKSALKMNKKCLRTLLGAFLRFILMLRSGAKQFFFFFFLGGQIIINVTHPLYILFNQAYD